jgi:hypothetical protein
MDVDTIAVGTDFRDAIRKAVSNADVVIAIIGRDWLSHPLSKETRLDNPNDFVRLEIETALTNNIAIIPTLIDGTEMPRTDQLPTYMLPLLGLNAAELRHAQFGPDFRKLLKAIISLRGSIPMRPRAVPILK